ELCGQSVSKSFVSNLIEKLDPVVKEWANRPLSLSYYPYLYVDAMYIKVREGDRVVSKAVYIAMALSKQGKREIIGLKVSHQETFVAWQEFLQELKARGIQSPKLIISDAHEGLKKAIAQEFLGTSWQRCTVHLKRNIFSHLPKKDTQEFRAQVIRIFRATTIDDARQFLDDVQKGFEDDVKYHKALKVLEEGFEDAIQYLSFPLTIHRFINSTNALERVNQEVRRRERVIRVFPNTNSAFRLIGAVLMDIDEQYKWKNPLNRKL
ncbi:IS256 family transposase, partial [Chungangia koreensis]